MSDQLKEFAEIPREFLKEGTQFMNRCQKPNKREFIKLCQAVGLGFVVMGAIGYFIRIIHIPVNQILVS
ncbi:protein transporter Sec61 subunit gamma [Microthyrium microscopicum]|uniref:Protein transporter Sec61 subunit gamma n=1 Tax=Microthyrium microscopicum TaxID=703497 RepID=A0A6A6UWU1_9PEZI|nr:protein transporter Sec61 subunit gamma [Microthyrium microscopicum]